MRSFFFCLGKALQILGLGTITWVVILFFGETGMKPLLNYSITGVAEFYGGYLIIHLSERT